MRTLDVSDLPEHGFGDRHPLWWGFLCALAIEGTMLVLLALSYFYVRARTSPWPADLGARGTAWLDTASLALWFASCVPMHLASNGALENRRGKLVAGLVVSTLLGLAGLVCRSYELATIPFRWDASSYGSMVWGLLVIQATHQLTGVLENGYYSVLYLAKKDREKHRYDVQVSTPLWYFVAAGGLLVWAVAYLEILLTRAP